MTGREFEVTAHTDPDGRVVWKLHGDINAFAKDGLEVVTPLASGGGALVLDFEDVDYINSTGIALIVGLLARARSTGMAVVAYGLSDHYRQIFEITRLSDFLGIYPDRAAALHATPAV